MFFYHRRRARRLVHAQGVSVPRRGFIVFIPEQIEKDHDLLNPSPGWGVFQSPEGDSLFFYTSARSVGGLWTSAGFSPPKGIHCFSTVAEAAKAFHQEAFQSPEGDSLFFYHRTNGGGFIVVLMPIRFSPPKGIHCFSTRICPRMRRFLRSCFSPPKGIHCFSTSTRYGNEERGQCFSPPKGIHCFSTRQRTVWELRLRRCGFSPPKGIHCFSTVGEAHDSIGSLQGFSPPKGIHCFSTRPQSRPLGLWQKVSVPRRGFIVFLLSRGHTESGNSHQFQSPEGDSLFFYLCQNCGKTFKQYEFQSPEGDSLFFYYMAQVERVYGQAIGFSPPKGIHCFSTQRKEVRMFRTLQHVSVPRRGFIVFLPTEACTAVTASSRVSVPRRGFIVFLPAEIEACTERTIPSSFSPPKGIHCFSTRSAGTRANSGPSRFSPPKGIHCFSTSAGEKDGGPLAQRSFSPPKGTHCFSTRRKRHSAVSFPSFQSPEGDSLFFYSWRTRL